MADQIEASFGAMPDHWGMKVTKTYRNDPTDTIAPKNNILPDGYVVVVTGGGQGIGEYIGRSYIQAKASGVVITGRRANLLEETKTKLEKLAAELGHKAKITICPGDAEKPESYAELRKHLEKEHGGRLDALVCNAGPGNSNSKGTWDPQIQNQDVNDWNSLIGVNLNGPYYAAHYLLPLMLKSPSQGKTIVNVISAAAHMTTGGMPPTGYSIAKFGEARLTQAIGEVYAKDGLQAFALHPGGVKTPSSTTLMPDDMQAMLTDDINLCGNWCVWLSKNRPQWLSGRYVAVNMDCDQLVAQKDEIEKGDKLKFRMVV